MKKKIGVAVLIVTGLSVFFAPLKFVVIMLAVGAVLVWPNLINKVTERRK
jgi:hypothetical protein